MSLSRGDDVSIKKLKTSRNEPKKLKSKHRKSKSVKEDSEVWVERVCSDHASLSVSKREDWMTTPLVIGTPQSVDCQGNKIPDTLLVKPGNHPRELNPFWKNGGKGLPTVSSSTHVESSLEGRSWILRSYKNALEEAEEKKISFKEVAVRRWGSVDKIYSMLQSVGVDPAVPDESGPPKKLHSCSRYLDEEFEPSCKDNFKIPSQDSESFVCPGDISDTCNMYTSKSLKCNWKRIDTPEESCETIAAVKVYNSVEPKLSVSNDTSKLPIVSTSDTFDYITESVINAVSAKLIRAEMVGKKEKILSLQSELKYLRSRKRLQDKKRPDQTESKNKTVLLTQTDRFGRIMPADMLYCDQNASIGKSVKGKSKLYSEDATSSIKQMIARENRTADDTYAAIANLSSKLPCNSEDIVDDVLDLNITSCPMKDNKIARQKILSQSRKMEEVLDNCKYCVNSSHFKPYLLVAMGMNAYLSVPSYQSLTEGHCLLVPIEHTTCSLQMDENVWSEIKIFQKGITRMFFDHDMDVVFTECYTSSAKRSHMYIDCIPIPKDQGGLAPMYFKKAILECDTEWAQNKKLIDTHKKGVRNSIPLGLPYFWVDFNNEGGFAHVIEDSSLFPYYFAKEVIGGLIDADPRLWLKPPRESYEIQRKKTSKLVCMWKPYNWTDKLN